MRSSLLPGLCAAALLLCAPARAEVIVLPQDGGGIKVATPLSKGTVWVRTINGWIMLGPTPPGAQRILRQVYEGAHEAIRFKSADGANLGEVEARGPKSLAPGKKGAFRATLAGGGPVIDSVEALIEVVSPKAE